MCDNLLSLSVVMLRGRNSVARALSIYDSAILLEAS